MNILVSLILAAILTVSNSLKIHYAKHDYDDANAYLAQLIEQQGKL